WSSSPASASSTATTWPRSSPRRGPPGRRSGSCASTSRICSMADPRRNRRRAGGRPPATRAPVDPARRAAYAVLTAVRVDDAYTSLALPAARREEGLTGRDAGFATELAAGTLRRRGTYDAILAACVDRPLAKVESKVLDALRLGVHQLLSMRVPP